MVSVLYFEVNYSLEAIAEMKHQEFFSEYCKAMRSKGIKPAVSLNSDAETSFEEITGKLNKIRRQLSK